MGYKVNRKVWQPIWFYYFEQYGLGSSLGGNGKYDWSNYNNDIFEVQSYNWDLDKEQEYNFWHKPSGYKIRWYKYAMRGAYANMDITAEQFVNVLQDCWNSIQDDLYTKIHLGDIDRWWESE